MCIPVAGMYNSGIFCYLLLYDQIRILFGWILFLWLFQQCQGCYFVRGFWWESDSSSHNTGWFVGLYYCILHTFCSLFPDIFSKWLGLSVNLIAFFIILLGLYHTSMLLYRSHWVSALVVLYYGFSLGGLNNVTYIRMYEFLTMLSVLLTYAVLKYIREGKVIFSIASGILIYLGFLTQYNFAFYAFFFLQRPVSCC